MSCKNCGYYLKPEVYPDEYRYGDLCRVCFDKIVERLTVPKLVGDGVADDTIAIQRRIDSAYRRGEPFKLTNGHYRVTKTLRMKHDARVSFFHNHFETKGVDIFIKVDAKS